MIFFLNSKFSGDLDFNCLPCSIIFFALQIKLYNGFKNHGQSYMIWVVYIAPPTNVSEKRPGLCFQLKSGYEWVVKDFLTSLGPLTFPSDWRLFSVTFCFPAQCLLCSSQAEINILQFFLYERKFHLKQSSHNLVVPICHHLQVGHELPVEFPGGEHGCRCLGNTFHFSGLKIAHFFQHWYQLREEANTSGICSGSARRKQPRPGRTQESPGPTGLGPLVNVCSHQFLAYSFREGRVSVQQKEDNLEGGKMTRSVKWKSKKRRHWERSHWPQGEASASWAQSMWLLRRGPAASQPPGGGSPAWIPHRHAEIKHLNFGIFVMHTPTEKLLRLREAHAKAVTWTQIE